MGNVVTSGTFTGNGAGLTNINNASFLPYNLGSATNITVSPTNGNAQVWTLTNASWITFANATTNYIETIRLDVIGSNTLTVSSAGVNNAAAMTITNAGPSAFLLDHSPGTTNWNIYKLK